MGAWCTGAFSAVTRQEKVRFLPRPLRARVANWQSGLSQKQVFCGFESRPAHLREVVPLRSLALFEESGPCWIGEAPAGLLEGVDAIDETTDLMAEVGLSVSRSRS